MSESSGSGPIRFGLTGLGGYAWLIAQLLARRTDIASLVGISEPDAARRAERVDTLAQWKTPVYERFDELLRQPIEAVWLPLPIGLHGKFMAEALAAGKAVLCEKPAAATVQEVDAMIAARDRAGLPAMIGYQHMANPPFLALKRRLVAGELGKLRAARVMGCWPRPRSYYTRNNWAGRQRVGDQWVLDSPLSNAMSHYLQLALYLLGGAVERTAEATNVEAELYRANPIENFDTCSVRIATEENADLLVLMTHASDRQIDVMIDLIGDRGNVRIEPHSYILWRGENGEEKIPLTGHAPDYLLEAFARHLRKQPATSALASLEIAKAPVVVVNCVAEAAPVHNVPPTPVAVKENETLYTIAGLTSVMQQCAAEGKMIHESKLAAWSKPARSKSARGYRQFTAPAM